MTDRPGMSGCRFLTVPDPAIHGPGRVVLCNRPSDEHPVTGEGRFVDHRNWLKALGIERRAA